MRPPTEPLCHAAGDADAAGHGHHHEHSHGDPEAHREPLARGAAAGRILYFDAFAGAAGDMCVAALVDLGVPFDVVRGAVDALGLAGVGVALRALPTGAIGASKFDVLLLGEQPERSYAQIRELLERATLNEGTRRIAQAIFARLARAESTVHRVALDDVHFHEVGAADSLADIVGAAACFDHLGDGAKVTTLCSALPMGRGHVHCQHGVIPLPAPATLLCLDRLWTEDTVIEAELVTPTGAAILGELALPSRWPPIRPERVGWGRGTRLLPDRPNALRVVLGTPSAGDSAALGGVGAALHPTARGAARTGAFGASTHVIVETNLDDTTGEQLGYVIGLLLGSGALDAWATPAVMKKGRPGWTLSALGPRALIDQLAEVVLCETSAIGVRFVGVSRLELERCVVSVTTEWGAVSVKVSGRFGSPSYHAKPEFDECKRLSVKHSVPVRRVIESALVAALALAPEQS